MSTSAITQQGILGIGPGVGAGMWTLVERWMPTVNSQSHVFNVEGDVDIRYAFVGTWLTTAHSGEHVIMIRPNDDSTAGNYSFGVVYSNSGAPARYQNDSIGRMVVAQATGSTADGYPAIFESVLFSSSGSYRMMRNIIWNTNTSANVDEIQIGATVWKNSASPITTLNMYCVNNSDNSAVTGVKAGSIIDLWKLGPASTTQGSSSAGGLTWSIITGDTTAASGNGYFIDASSAPVTLTLPATVALNMQIGIRVINVSNTITIAANGNRIESSTSDLIMNVADSAMTLVYCSNAKGWLITGLK